MPAVQWSAAVQALPSSHAVPSGLAGFEHTPVDGLQVPASWHWSGAGHTTLFPPVQVPPWHVSVCVHAFPSLHAVPSALEGIEHPPVAPSHEPGSWHWSGAGHTTPFAPLHAPPCHVPLCVQPCPSPHRPPFGSGC